MRPIHVLLCTLFIPLALQARDLRLWGQVKAGKPLEEGSWIIAAGDSSHLDASGNFSFSALPAGKLDIKVIAPGQLPLRHRLRLRHEHFLELKLKPERFLSASLPTDNSLPSEPRRPLQGDLFADGQQRNLRAWDSSLPWPVPTKHGLKSSGLWGGLSRPGITDLAGAVRVSPSGDGFFASQDWNPGRAITHSEHETRFLASSYGLEFESELDKWLGNWQQFRLHPKANRGKMLDGTGQLLGTDLDHRWILPRNLLLDSRVWLDFKSMNDIDSESPELLLHQPGFEAMRNADLEQLESGWQSRLHWVAGAQTRLEARGWYLLEQLTSRGEELDVASDRLVIDPEDSPQDPEWFDTSREESRQQAGLRLALDQVHDKGTLQAGLEVDQQLRKLESSLHNTYGAEGRLDWLALQEERIDFKIRLRDDYHLFPNWRVDAVADLVYSYYSISRDRLRLFSLTASPDVDLSQDLLSLHPDIALVWSPALDWSTRLRWRRSQRMLRPEEWWNPGDTAEDPWVSPLVHLEGDQRNQALLAEPEWQEMGLEQNFRTRQLKGSLRVWASEMKHLPLALFSEEDEVLDLAGTAPILRGQIDLQQAGLDLHLEMERGKQRASLQLQTGFLLDTALLHWHPASDTSWTVEALELDRMPGEADWALSFSWEYDTRIMQRACQLKWKARATGARHAWDDYRAASELAPEWLLDASFSTQLSPRLSLRFFARNLLDEEQPVWQRSNWLDGGTRTSAMRERSFGLELGFKLRAER